MICVVLEGLNKMTTLAKDKFEHGETVGSEKERKRWAHASVEDAITIVNETGLPVEKVLSMITIPEGYRPKVEKEVRRRLRILA